MTVQLSEDVLQALDDAIERALGQGDEMELRVLGYGEISTVVAWQEGDQVLACKRLPLFSDEETLQAYLVTVGAYLERLRQGGVQPVETSVQHRRRADGRLATYCIQPILPADTLLPALLAGSDEGAALAIFERVVQGIRGCVSPRLGLDGQISNWAVVEGELCYLDITTPMMRDESGRELLDTDLFLASLPWALRGLVRRFMLGSILGKYYDVRGIVVDLLANLYKERLERHVPPLLARANELLEPVITVQELQRYYRSDARMWAFLQRLRRMDRWWQRRVRRRTYPFLLPGKIERHV